MQAEIPEITQPTPSENVALAARTVALEAGLREACELALMGDGMFGIGGHERLVALRALADRKDEDQ